MDFVDLMRDLRVPTKESGHHHCRDGWVQIDCPFCRTIDKWHLGYSKERGSINCWRCGTHSLASVIMELTHCEFRDAIRYIKKLDRVRFDKVSKPTGKLKLPKGVGELLPAHRKYLKKRGFDPDTVAKQWNVERDWTAG